MKSEEFGVRYRLLKVLSDGPVRSYTAEQRGSGRVVLVHVVEDALSDLSVELSDLVRRLEPADRAKVLEVVTVGPSVAFVTQVIPGNQGFEEWVRAKAATARPPREMPARPAPPPGEFTAMFKSPEAEPLPPVVPPPAPPAAPDQAPARGGSFTDLFRAPAAHPTPAPEIPPPPPAAAVTPAAPVKVVSLRVTPPPPPVAAQPPVKVPTPDLGRAGPPIAATPPVARQGALFTPEQPPPPTRQPEVWSGPSDYTRQLNSAAEPPPPAPEVPPEAPVPAEGRRSLVPLLLGLNLVVIVVTGLVVYFALRRC